MTTTAMNGSSGSGKDNGCDSDGDDDDNGNDNNDDKDNNNDNVMSLPPCPFTIWLLCANQAADILLNIDDTLQNGTMFWLA